VLELRSVFGTGGGPEKTILLGAVKTDPARAKVTVCYVRDTRDPVFGIDRRAEQMGVDYVEATERHSLDPGVWGQLKRIAGERGIHLVHSHEYKTDVLAWLLARRTGVAVVSTAHGWTGHSARERLCYYPMNKRLLARFPAVIAVSGQIRQELVAHGARADRVHVLLNGIDPALFSRDHARRGVERARLGLAPDDLVIGSAGRLAPQKRFDLLLDAFAAIRNRRPAAKLLIAGEGAERDALESRLGRLGLQASCRLLGQVDDIIGFHHALDVFVQSSDYEGTPNVVLEAMALETPVVATDVGGTAEICRAGVDGLLIACGSAEALAAAIESTLADSAGRDARVRAARERVETELSFDRRVRRLEDLYDRLAREEAR
jgi:glycosyltransferase involved in cell wall biosynthesis